MSDAEFTLEKQRVAERLGAVEQELVRLSTKLEGHAGVVTELLKQHQVVLYGTNGEKGIVTRLDRVEQFKRAVDKHLAGLWTALTVGGVRVVFDWFRR